MASKKIKNNLQERLVDAIQDVLESFNENVGGRFKKTALNVAKKISNKFTKKAKVIAKEEKKAAKKKKKASKAKAKSSNKTKGKSKK